MRSTSKINNSNSLLYISRNFQKLSKVTSQVAMQQQVIELDDDPLSANIGIKMLNMMAKAESYNRNIKSGIGSLGLVDGYLAAAKTTIQEIHTLTIGAADASSATATIRQSDAARLNSHLQSLISKGNAMDGSRYLFGGTNTTTPPFSIVNGRYVHYSGNDRDLNILVDNGTTMRINSTGSEIFGNMTTRIASRDMNPRVNLGTDSGTPLADLNGGQGVPKGKITVHYSAYPDGLEVDLAGCDTLEDVKDRIEQATADASRALDPAKNPWLDGRSLDWHDLQDRYVRVTMNPDGNGISLQERDRGEPLPEPTAAELRRDIAYSGAPGYNAGEAGAAEGAAMPADGGGLVVRGTLRVDDYALNKVAAGLGIKGVSGEDGFLHGSDLNPVLSEKTLLADLEGYNDADYTFTNGGKPSAIVVKETSTDTNNSFSAWNFAGASKGDNTGPEGELYARAVNRGTASEPRIELEIYTKPFSASNPPRATDLVATGVYTGKAGGGTVVFEEANNSGISGSVGIVLPPDMKEVSVDLRIDFQDSLQKTVSVPAFEEEQFPNGESRDILNVASGWNIRGLDRPPAVGYDENHPVTTDLDGNVSVNYRYDAERNSMIVELSRPASGTTPAAVIATGSIALGTDSLGNANVPPVLAKPVSGRIELIGAPGFEQVSGSVYIELPSGIDLAAGSAAAAASGSGIGDATQNTYRLTEPAPPGTIVLGGAMRLEADLALGGPMTLKADTAFKQGQTFLNDVALPGGGLLRAGTPLASDTVIPKGVTVEASGPLLAGTVLAAGQEFTAAGELPPETMIPRGSYYTDPASPGFPRNAMVAGYDVKATFATVEDLNRAVEQAGVYVKAGISEDGRSLEFRSSLAGAWLTVSEDTDCYEQMGDRHEQISGLNLNGLVKGVNTDRDGNVYTEVVYYPPDPLRPDAPVRLTSEDGTATEIQPGYYVRVYSDPDQMRKDYEDRDNTKLVAEGFVPAGEWNPDFNANDAAAAAAAGAEYGIPPFIPKADQGPNGVWRDLILEERNDSGVWGEVDLDYHGGAIAYAVSNIGTDADGVSTGDFDYATRDNANITVYPGGLRPSGAHSVVMQEWNISPVEPGVNCDYAGTFHGRVAADAATASGVSITLYKDSSNTIMSARNNPDDPNEPTADGRVTLYAADRHGNIARDANGDPVAVGSVTLPGWPDSSALADGASESFEVKTGALRNGGQQREENVFATINDILDALNQNDEEALHNLIGRIDADEKRALAARGDAGARSDRLMLLSERHADDVLNFTALLTSRVGMDDQALAVAVMDYQASTNAYNAAMQVSAQVMQLSLLQYL